MPNLRSPRILALLTVCAPVAQLGETTVVLAVATVTGAGGESVATLAPLWALKVIDEFAGTSACQFTAPQTTFVPAAPWRKVVGDQQDPTHPAAQPRHCASTVSGSAPRTSRNALGTSVLQGPHTRTYSSRSAAAP